MVAVKINGKHRMLKVSIDESLLKADEKEVLEDLIVAAYNDAKGKLDTAFSDQMGALTGGLDLPPGFKLPF
jgi:nucleoid-associated protein EbfC